ncbi:MAG: lysozyme [Rickettsiales bacterium]|nr:lysozyme [Rickettsiales bacterium]
MHRFTNAQGIELIKEYEGFSQTPYICAAGRPTIGFGHKIRKKDKMVLLTLAEAESLLIQDLFIAERAVIRAVSRELTDNQFAALVSFTFNLGAAALQRSCLRQKVNYGQDKEAAREFLRWVYVGGKRLQGLANRRRAEGILFLKE